MNPLPRILALTMFAGLTPLAASAQVTPPTHDVPEAQAELSIDPMASSAKLFVYGLVTKDGCAEFTYRVIGFSRGTELPSALNFISSLTPYDDGLDDIDGATLVASRSGQQFKVFIPIRKHPLNRPIKSIDVIVKGGESFQDLAYEYVVDPTSFKLAYFEKCPVQL